MSKIKNIFNLTKILFLNSFQNPYIIDLKTNKINKKSISNAYFCICWKLYL